MMTCCTQLILVLKVILICQPQEMLIKMIAVLKSKSLEKKLHKSAKIEHKVNFLNKNTMTQQ